jgi:hypothetical protein
MSFLLVYIGNKLPTYFNDCINQIFLFNPRCKVYLGIEDEDISLDLIDKKENVIIVNLHCIFKSSNHSIFLEKSRQYKGFWTYTIERFFYIEEIMKKLNIENIIHIEIDNLIYFNVNDMVSLFLDLEFELSVPFDNDSRGIASIMFIKNHAAINKLNEYIKKTYEYRRGQFINDMMILSNFKKSFPNYIQNLPIIFPEYSYKLSPNLKTLNIENPNFYSDNIFRFNGIFDAAAIGQYLGGIDTIHNSSDTK